MNVAAIIPAAGAGRRIGGVRKAFMPVAAKPMLQYSIEVFLAHPEIASIVVALAAEDVGDPPAWLAQSDITLVVGGAERADSVRAALRALPPAADAVIVHDAARPLIRAEMIDRVLEKVRHGQSATLGIQVTDTLHEVTTGLDIRATPDRSLLWRAQTPQAFPREVLERAFATSHSSSTATDEAGLVAAEGWPVSVVPGEPWNIKVTTPEDLALVEAALHGRRP